MSKKTILRSKQSILRAFYITWPSPVMERGMPAQPESVSLGFEMVGSPLNRFTCTGSRPLWIEERVGEQNMCA